MPVELESQIEKLLDAFQSHGWALEGSLDISSDWWFKDILHLVSKWKPVNTDLYMTLLTDPQVLDKKLVWCIGISSTIPDSRHFKFLDQLTFNDIKRTDLKHFVYSVNAAVLI